MGETLNLDFERHEQMPLHEFTEKAYLNYSMYVILDRALPHIADGLKPVQRRILYAMSELGLKATSKFKKSARTVGDVIGKFHPHGDSACYESMVLMAQNFTYRYPLVDGQGNWGSIDDPKSFAAMRYTESRLTPYADSLLNELELGTVDWNANFDGTLQEPGLLPSRLPNILLNGTTGIAVGMATDIPPHNLGEIANACIKLLKEPRCSMNELCKVVHGPDFPTDAEIITPKKEIRAIYQNGSGSIKMRAIWEKDEGNIIITALPYQSSGNKILEQIDTQIQAKKLPMVENYRDESDHESPVRLVLVPRSNRVNLEKLMSHLFATTDLERSYRVNLNMVGLNGRPQVKDLKTILNEWLKFRIETVRRRLQYQLDKIIDRIHILQGLMTAFHNIDEIISIIREDDDPKLKLMKKFKLSEAQAEAILELKLRRLAKLEEIRIKGELGDLQKERKALEQVLGSKQRLKTLVRKELDADVKLFGDKRRSPIVVREEATAIAESDLVPVEPVTVILSEKGLVRTAKSHDIDPESLNYRPGDHFRSAGHGNSNQGAVFLDSTGRCYTVAVTLLPSARGFGEPVSSWLNPPDGATFNGVMLGLPGQLYLLGSEAGYGFIARLEDLYSKNKSGKAVILSTKGTGVLTPSPVTDFKKDKIVAVSSFGRLLTFPVSELPVLAKGKGLKIIQIPPAKLKTREEYVTAITAVPEDGVLIIYAGQRKLRLKNGDLDNYRGERGRRGNLLPRGYRNVSRLQIEFTASDK